jgi:small subunit ribosomal protein S8
MDKVGDLLIRIKNGYMASKKEVQIPYSKLSLAICTVLLDEGYIERCKQDDRMIVTTLKYEDRKPVLSDVKRISKPGRRIYKSHKAMPRVLNGLGIAIISTPQGVMTDRKARKLGLGGEVMAYVW